MFTDSLPKPEPATDPRPAAGGHRVAAAGSRSRSHPGQEPTGRIDRGQGRHEPHAERNGGKEATLASSASMITVPGRRAPRSPVATTRSVIGLPSTCTVSTAMPSSICQVFGPTATAPRGGRSGPRMLASSCATVRGIGSVDGELL